MAHNITFRTVMDGRVISEKIEGDQSLFPAAIGMIRDCRLRGYLPDRFSMTQEANDQLFPQFEEENGSVAIVEEFVGLPCSIDRETKGIVIALHVPSGMKAITVEGSGNG